MKAFGAASAVMLFSLHTPVSLANTNPEYHYRLSNYPKGSATCTDGADDVAGMLVKQTGVTLVAADCAGTSDYGYDFDIVYHAAQPLNLVSTGLDASGARVPGLYATAAACTAALPAEVEHFHGVTGLVPVVAYCSQGGSSATGPWALRVDAFGAPASSPHVSGGMELDQPVGIKLEALEGTIQAALLQRGVDVRKVRVRPSMDPLGVEVFYYAGAVLPFVLAEHSESDTQAQCDEQLSLARTVIAPSANQPLAMYCAVSALGDYYVTGVYLGETALTEGFTEATFDSYGSCMANRAAEADSYSHRLGHNVAGALCTHDVENDTGWRVRLFEHPRGL